MPSETAVQFLTEENTQREQEEGREDDAGTRDVELTRSDGSGHRGSFSDTDKLESQL